MLAFGPFLQGTVPISSRAGNSLCTPSPVEVPAWVERAVNSSVPALDEMVTVHRSSGPHTNVDSRRAVLGARECSRFPNN